MLFRSATVLTMDGADRLLADTDVLVTDGRIAAIGQGMERSARGSRHRRRRIIF